MRRTPLLLLPALFWACGETTTAPAFDTPEPQFSHTAAGPTTGLVGHWALDGNAQDSGPNGLHGVMIGATATADQDGTASGAIAVGGGAHAAIPDNALLNFSTDFTVSFWVQPATAGGYEYIVSKGRDVSNGYAFVRGIDNVTFSLRNGFYTPLIGGVSAAASTGSWHHVVGTVDNANLTISLYIDGALASQGALSEPFVANNNHALVLGRHYTEPEGYPLSWPYPFQGDLDELRIYDRVLSDLEIGALAGHPTKDECKNGGWASFGFKNQGQCVRYAETGKDSR